MNSKKSKQLRRTVNNLFSELSDEVGYILTPYRRYYTTPEGKKVEYRVNTFKLSDKCKRFHYQQMKKSF